MASDEEVLLCWGKCVEGQLGIKNENDSNYLNPTFVHSPVISRIQSIACGERHSIILTTDGCAYSAGDNEYGQLGRSGPQKRFELISSLETKFIVQAACGNEHSMVLDRRGDVYCFGNNKYGQLGFSLQTNVITIPKKITCLQEIINIACASFTSFAIDYVGTFCSWGSNHDSVLCRGKFIHSTAPSVILDATGHTFTKISAGLSHGVVLSTNGNLYGWGNNSNGQVGISVEHKCIEGLVHISHLSDYIILDVTCGNYHTVALTNTGKVFTFGSGGYGQLGHGSLSQSFTPRQVLDLSSEFITHIACGRDHTLAYSKKSNALYAFGSSHSGQCGNLKAREHESTPFLVRIKDNILGNSKHRIDIIECGGSHCIAKVVRYNTSYLALSNGNADAVDSTFFSNILCYGKGDGKIVDHNVMMNYKKLDSPLKIEIRRKIKIIFGNISCLNLSFVRRENTKWRPNKHNIDFEMLQEFSQFLCDNDEFVLLILETLTQLLSKLSYTSTYIEYYRFTYLIFGLRIPYSHNQKYLCVGQEYNLA